MKLPRAYNATELKKYMNERDGQHESGRWVPVRPVSLIGVRAAHRMRLAWWVFTGKADAIFWEVE